MFSWQNAKSWSLSLCHEYNNTQDLNSHEFLNTKSPYVKRTDPYAYASCLHSDSILSIHIFRGDWEGRR